jgi:DNA-binding CsgD family transcriptional regulator
MAEGGVLELAALRHYAEGRFGEAAEAFDRATAAWTGAHAQGELRCRWGAAESTRRAGDRDEARRRLLELETRLEAMGHAPFLGWVRRSLRALGERRSARIEPVDGSPLTARELEILELSSRGLADAEIAARLGIGRIAVARSAESAAAKLGAVSRLGAIAALAASPTAG